LMSDSADCFAATVARPDGLDPRDRVITQHESRHRSGNSAQTATHSLVIDEFEAINSRQNRTGRVSGYCGVPLARIIPRADHAPNHP
jgi:hypothetical protein